MDVLLQDVVFENAKFFLVKAETGMLEDVLDKVMCKQAGDELGSTVAFREQLTPSELASIGDVTAVGHKLGILVLKISQRPITFLFRGQRIPEVCRAEGSDLVSENDEGV